MHKAGRKPQERIVQPARERAVALRYCEKVIYSPFLNRPSLPKIMLSPASHGACRFDRFPGFRIASPQGGPGLGWVIDSDAYRQAKKFWQRNCQSSSSS